MPNRVVLLLEDETWLSEIYASALRAQNYVVYLANSAQGAIDMLDDHPEIELVLVDLLLPQHNGLTFIYEALSQTDWQERRFVLMSSLPPETVIDGQFSLDQLNVVDYIYKPSIKPFDLGARVATALT